MSLRTSLLKTAQIVRGIASPTTVAGGPGLDVWINTLTIIQRTWPGEERGVGDPDDGEPLVLAPNPEIKAVGNTEVAGTGGLYAPKRVRVGHITPYFAGPPSGGYTPEQLAPSFDAVESYGQPAREVIYRIAGPLAGDYERVSADFTDPFEYVLILQRINASPSPAA